MAATGTDFAKSFATLPAAEQQAAVKTITAQSPGLFDLDRDTRRLIWGAVFVVLFVIALGAFFVVLRSWSVETVTTTGQGAAKTTTVTHPDVSAAYAIISAVVAGIVGLLVPSPTQSNSPTP